MHHHLVAQEKRTRTGLLVETAEDREVLPAGLLSCSAGSMRILPVCRWYSPEYQRHTSVPCPLYVLSTCEQSKP